MVIQINYCPLCGHEIDEAREFDAYDCENCGKVFMEVWQLENSSVSHS